MKSKKYNIGTYIQLGSDGSGSNAVITDRKKINGEWRYSIEYLLPSGNLPSIHVLTWGAGEFMAFPTEQLLI